MVRVTPLQFRKLALSLPEASEGSHMGTADFRVRNKIFATLGDPDPAWGVVALAPDQQALLAETNPGVFTPVPGSFGMRGWTRVRLAAVDAGTLKHAVRLAWHNRAPKQLMAGRNGPATKTKSDRRR
jgi:hypothetical protein